MSYLIDDAIAILSKPNHYAVQYSDYKKDGRFFIISETDRKFEQVKSYPNSIFDKILHKLERSDDLKMEKLSVYVLSKNHNMRNKHKEPQVRTLGNFFTKGRPPDKSYRIDETHLSNVKRFIEDEFFDIEKYERCRDSMSDEMYDFFRSFCIEGWGINQSEKYFNLTQRSGKMILRFTFAHIHKFYEREKKNA